MRPRIRAAPSVTSTPIRGDAHYRSLERITLALDFSEAVTVDTSSGTPRLTVSVGANERPAGYDAGTGTTTLTFSWPVKAADLDADGISVAANRLALRGGTITDRVGNAANLNHAALAVQSGHRVSGRRSPPRFGAGSASLTIAEDHGDGALVGSVTASDADNGPHQGEVVWEPTWSPTRCPGTTPICSSWSPAAPMATCSWPRGRGCPTRARPRTR